MSIHDLQIVAQDSDGNLTTVPLGELCCICAERPIDGDDYLCAECRSNWEMWESERAKREK